MEGKWVWRDLALCGLKMLKICWVNLTNLMFLKFENTSDVIVEKLFKEVELFEASCESDIEDEAEARNARWNGVICGNQLQGFESRCFTDSTGESAASKPTGSVQFNTTMPLPHQETSISTSSSHTARLYTAFHTLNSHTKTQSIPSNTMAEAQPPTIVEGATTGDVDDEIPVTAKSAEDRKAAAALSSLDARENEEAPRKDVDQEAMKEVMKRLGGTAPAKKGAVDEQKVVKKAVKVDPLDVGLLVSLDCVLCLRAGSGRAVLKGLRVDESLD